MKTRYKTVTAFSPLELDTLVEMLLNEGGDDDPSWECQGGVSAHQRRSGNTLYAQALVMWVPDKEDIDDALTIQVREKSFDELSPKQQAGFRKDEIV